MKKNASQREKNKVVMVLSILAVLILAVAPSVASGQKQKSAEPYTDQFFAMDTIMQITAYGNHAKEAVKQARAEVDYLDAIWSVSKEDSEITILNNHKEADVSDETRELLQRSQDIHRETEGAFDITIYPLMNLWGFPAKAYRVPTSEEIAAMLPLVDETKMQIDGKKVCLQEGQEVDLGGIAKGYASAKIMEIFEEYQVDAGIVSLGGNVQTYHTKIDGALWKVGLTNPKNPDGEPIAVLQTADKAVITSGGYERYFEENGKTYIHILDPKTGYPAESDLASVTIVSADGTLADALSTSLFIMGREDAIRYWKMHENDFQMVLITKENEILVTDEIADQLTTKAEKAVIKK